MSVIAPFRFARMNTLLIAGVATATIIAGCLLLKFATRHLSAMNQRHREIWREKQARREDREMEKAEGKKSRPIKSVIGHQIEEINQLKEIEIPVQQIARIGEPNAFLSEEQHRSVTR